MTVNMVVQVHCHNMQSLFKDCDSVWKMLKNKLDIYSFDLYLVNKYIDRVL